MSVEKGVAFNKPAYGAAWHDGAEPEQGQDANPPFNRLIPAFDEQIVNSPLAIRLPADASPRRVMIVSALVIALAACSSSKTYNSADEANNLSPRLVRAGDPVPKGGGVYKLGSPYLAGGKWYTPVADRSYDEVGLASWYGDFFHGRSTANGEIYDMNALTAAHPTLPMPAYAKVTNLANNRSVVVRVNDRGPYGDGRIIDLSRRAAELLGFFNRGIAKVRVQYYGIAPLSGDDSLERKVLAAQPWAAHVETVRTPAAATLLDAQALATHPTAGSKGAAGKSYAFAATGGWTTSPAPVFSQTIGFADGK